MCLLYTWCGSPRELDYPIRRQRPMCRRDRSLDSSTTTLELASSTHEHRERRQDGSPEWVIASEDFLLMRFVPPAKQAGHKIGTELSTTKRRQNLQEGCSSLQTCGASWESWDSQGQRKCQATSGNLDFNKVRTGKTNPSTGNLTSRVRLKRRLPSCMYGWRRKIKYDEYAPYPTTTPKSPLGSNLGRFEIAVGLSLR